MRLTASALPFLTLKNHIVCRLYKTFCKVCLTFCVARLIFSQVYFTFKVRIMNQTGLTFKQRNKQNTLNLAKWTSA